MATITLSKKVILKGELELLTGLHIGAGNDRVEIGGLDNPVVRAVLKDNAPYIPGSSLKGKIRSLLEQAYGTDCLAGHKGSEDAEGKCPICQAFGGSAANEKNHASRIFFRDAYLIPSSQESLKNAATDLPYTEVKTEVAISRVTGTVEGRALRQTERIPAGAVFNVEIVVNVYNGDLEQSEEQLRQWLQSGITLLNRDYLGGSGSRGYGHVKLRIKDVKVLQKAEDAEGVPEFKETGEVGSWKALLDE